MHFCSMPLINAGVNRVLSTVLLKEHLEANMGYWIHSVLILVILSTCKARIVFVVFLLHTIDKNV